VLEAAYSAIGTPYQWGGSSPETGFDCSGFTMWAWSHAGVFLPHSSAAQYAALPHVAREDLQAGDLLFFYSPISHVGIYVGGGRMIHASHPGVPVGVVAVYWDSFVGAARPG
jgi:cell wall-associated NlpC family hydrolase